MTLFLGAQDLEATLPYDLAVRVIEEGFRALTRGSYVMPQRTFLATAHGALITMPVAGDSRMAVKIATVHTRNAAAGIPTVQATVLLISEKDGELLSILDGTSLTVIRTAAASAVATRYLANEGPATLGVLGTGPLAIGHVRALALVRELKTVRMFSPRLSSRRDMVTASLSDLKLNLVFASSAEEVVRNSNVVVLATTSPTPVIEWTWVTPGTHINAVGSHTPRARELDSATVLGSRIICDSVEACWAEAGDLLIPHAEGVIDPTHATTSLGQVILGEVKARTLESSVTVFKSVGLAFQDLCAAQAAFQSAMESRRGTLWQHRAY